MEITHPRLLIIGAIFIVLLVVFGGPPDSDAEKKAQEEAFIKAGGDPLIKSIEEFEDQPFFLKPPAPEEPRQDSENTEKEPSLSDYTPRSNVQQGYGGKDGRTMPSYMYSPRTPQQPVMPPPAPPPVQQQAPAQPQPAAPAAAPPASNSYYPPLVQP